MQVPRAQARGKSPRQCGTGGPPARKGPPWRRAAQGTAGPRLGAGVVLDQRDRGTESRCREDDSGPRIVCKVLNDAMLLEAGVCCEVPERN